MFNWNASIGRCLAQVGRFAILAAGLLGAGCARLGEPLEQRAAVAKRAELTAILHDLSANNTAITTFRAAGSSTLKLPELDSVKRFRSGTIAFRKPAEVYLATRHRTGAVVFRLISVDKAFLIEAPTEREYMYRAEGETVEGLPFRVSPADIAREMFIPERWAELTEDDVRIVSREPAGRRVVLEIGPAEKPRRRITVAGMPWVVVRSELLDERGRIRAVSERSDYHILDGFRFPSTVHAEFPAHDAEMMFEMRNIRINAPLDDALFDIQDRLNEIKEWTAR